METVEPPVIPKPNEPPTPEAGGKLKLMDRFKAFIARYGFLGVVVHMVSCVIFYAIFVGIIHAGFRVDSAAGTAGTFAGAYVLYKATQIPRLALTFALTPLIDKLIRRVRHQGPPPAAPPGT